MHPTRPTYFLTCISHQRRAIFQSDESASIIHNTILNYAEQKKFILYAFVVMPDHIHVLFEPATDASLEKCVQFIKGGISFRLRERIRSEIWQREYHDHRIRDDEEFLRYRSYIQRNPAKRGLTDWPWIWLAQGLKPRIKPSFVRRLKPPPTCKQRQRQERGTRIKKYYTNG